jgi:ketosteroid isomerase-like protein
MLYSYTVKKLIRQSFENVNSHNYDELLKAVAPNVHHRFAGAHSIGGERHDKEAMRRWLGRVGRVLPNLHIKVNDIWVKGRAVAHQGVRAVGRDGHIVEWRLLVLQPRFSCYYYAMGQSLFARRI